MTDIDVHHLAAAYALDALDDRERAAFEGHYGACEVCRNDVLELHQTLTHVAESLATAPPAAMKAKVMAEVAATRQLSPSVAPVVVLDQRRRARTLMSLAVAAAAVAMVVVGVMSLRGDDDETDTFSSDLARVMEQPDSQLLSLENQSGAEGSFKVAWSNTLGEAVLIGEGLPATPDDKAYELWLITPDDSMAMYVLDPAADGNVHRSIEAPASPSAWAITVEPAEGSATATGDIIFIADV
jgi:anti-sigma-K factor RskA